MGRRPGPSSTRAVITAAAAARFTAAGYDATSLRQVAADAGVDPALVRRFFGSKEELFTAAASALIDPGQALAVVAGEPVEAAGERLLRYFLSLLGDVSQPGPLLGLVRSAVTSEHAARLLRQFLAEGLLADIAVSFPSDRPGLGAALAASQLVGVAVARYAVQLPPLTAASTDELVCAVAPVLQYYLTGQAISPKEES
ncbi:MAG TPA: TetR family transcriptional regulator [Streptosporangiaceae bacterium]|nr:TetR family transcriptional regulator [Streptosporangiaceae bacterium]